MRIRYCLTLCLLALSPLISAQNSSSAMANDWKDVEQAMGRSAQPQPGGVIKFALPRKDLKVSLNGVAIKPSLALGSWVAFMRHGAEAMVMGDLVVTEEEVAPVMAALQKGGVHEAALHNHLVGESPHVMYMHLASHGDPVQMARVIHDAVALTKTPPPDSTTPPALDLGFDQAQVEKAFGRSGKVNGGILQFSIARTEPITDSGIAVPPSMGVATAINFQGTGSGKAAITGDFVLLASEVNDVIKALTDSGIQVTALHSHMLTEEPRLFFMHFWANDDAVKLAGALHAALDKTNSAK